MTVLFPFQRIAVNIIFCTTLFSVNKSSAKRRRIKHCTGNSVVTVKKYGITETEDIL